MVLRPPVEPMLAATVERLPVGPDWCYEPKWDGKPSHFDSKRTPPGMRAPKDIARVAIEAIRAQGRRALVARGWADLALIDDRDDCFALGEINQQALFGRVAAVVHHGGAGTTTTTAARAGGKFKTAGVWSVSVIVEGGRELYRA